MNKRAYTQPELELRKVIAFETMSTSGDGMTDDDNDFDVGDLWTDL
jgi:hypothetical protein